MQNIETDSDKILAVVKEILSVEINDKDDDKSRGAVP